MCSLHKFHLKCTESLHIPRRREDTVHWSAAGAGLVTPARVTQPGPALAARQLCRGFYIIIIINIQTNISNKNYQLNSMFFHLIHDSLYEDI